MKPMGTTFVGIECAGNRVRARHAAVVLERRKGGVQLSHWSCRIYTDEELLGYLAAEAGTSGVIALHGRDADHTGLLLKRIYRVLDYRLLFALAPKHRTRALVRVEPADVQRAFGGSDGNPRAALDAIRSLSPGIDFGAIGEHTPQFPVKMAVNRQTLQVLPQLDGSNLATEVVGDSLP